MRGWGLIVRRTLESAHLVGCRPQAKLEVVILGEERLLVEIASPLCVRGGVGVGSEARESRSSARLTWIESTALIDHRLQRLALFVRREFPRKGGRGDREPCGR